MSWARFWSFLYSSEFIGEIKSCTEFPGHLLIDKTSVNICQQAKTLSIINTGNELKDNAW